MRLKLVKKVPLEPSPDTTRLYPSDAALWDAYNLQRDTAYRNRDGDHEGNLMLFLVLCADVVLNYCV